MKPVSLFHYRLFSSLPLKVHMTRKIRQLKNFQSRVKWRFSFCDIFSCSRDAPVIWSLMASSVVRVQWWRKIKNIYANKEAVLLKLGRDVAPYEIYQMVHILMLLWQHARFQSPASSKWNSTTCDSTRQIPGLIQDICQSHRHWVSSKVK